MKLENITKSKIGYLPKNIKEYKFLRKNKTLNVIITFELFDDLIKRLEKK